MKKSIILILALIINNILIIKYLEYFHVKNIIIKNNRSLNVGGNINNRETLILRDMSSIKDRGNKPKLKPVELGFYNYGAGIFTENMFEFWTSGVVSFASQKHTPSIEIRNKKDTTAGIWLNGSGRIGSQGDQIQMYIGDWNGGEENEDTSKNIYASHNNVVTNKSFQFTFNKNGILEVKKDIIIDGKSIIELLSDKKCTDK